MIRLSVRWLHVPIFMIGLLLCHDVDGNAQSMERKYKQRDPAGKVQLLYLGGGEWHDYLATAAQIRWELETNDHYYMTYTEDQDVLTRLDSYDVVLLNHMHREMTDEQERSLLETVRNGKPLVVLHATTAAYTKPGKQRPAFHAMIGTDGVQPKHPAIGTFRVKVADRTHAVTRGITDFEIYDELFLLGNQTLQPNLHVLLTADQDGKSHPQAWVRRFGKGNVFYLSLGHGEESMKNRNFMQLFRQGLQWVMVR